MEIRNVEKVRNEYPNANEITNEEIKNNIPHKWVKLGLTALVISLMLTSCNIRKPNDDFALSGSIVQIDDSAIEEELELESEGNAEDLPSDLEDESAEDMFRLSGNVMTVDE